MLNTSLTTKLKFKLGSIGRILAKPSKTGLQNWITFSIHVSTLKIKVDIKIVVIAVHLNRKAASSELEASS